MEYIIESVSIFLGKLNQLCYCKSLSSPFFRGHADSKWELKPSLFRMDGDEETEIGLIQEALFRFPNLFEGCDTMLQKMVTMQHYSLPTRMLDVSSNPLIALYFACCESMNVDGKVIYMYPSNCQNIKDFSFILDCIDYFNNHAKGKLPWSSVVEKLSRIVGIKDDFLKELLSKNLFYQPPLSNDRIRNQQGAFVFKSILEFDNDYVSLSQGDVSDSFEDDYFIIPSGKKTQIIEELDRIGINEAFIYPDAEHQMKYVKNKIQNKTESSLGYKLKKGKSYLDDSRS